MGNPLKKLFVQQNQTLYFLFTLNYIHIRKKNSGVALTMRQCSRVKRENPNNQAKQRVTFIQLQSATLLKIAKIKYDYKSFREFNGR